MLAFAGEGCVEGAILANDDDRVLDARTGMGIDAEFL